MQKETKGPLANRPDTDSRQVTGESAGEKAARSDRPLPAAAPAGDTGRAPARAGEPTIGTTTTGNSGEK